MLRVFTAKMNELDEKSYGWKKGDECDPWSKEVYIDKYIDSIEATQNHTKSKYTWTGFSAPFLCACILCPRLKHLNFSNIHYCCFLRNALQQIPTQFYLWDKGVLPLLIPLLRILHPFPYLFSIGLRLSNIKQRT